MKALISEEMLGNAMADSSSLSFSSEGDEFVETLLTKDCSAT
jgi:hypothetical protein